nr:DNA-binding pseudobarrel domain-containing protein [Tanacetum cinerariifolium]
MECPLNKEVKSVEEVKYGEFGRSSPYSNGAKYRVGTLGYYTCIDNRPPFVEKRPSLEELVNKHLEESTRRMAEMEE